MTDYCRNGEHPWIEENIYRRTDGKRGCRPCRLDRDRAAREMRRKPSNATLDWRADDIDPVAVDRVIHGVPVGRPLHPRERLEVAKRLAADDGGIQAVQKVLRTNSAETRRLLREAS